MKNGERYLAWSTETRSYEDIARAILRDPAVLVLDEAAWSPLQLALLEAPVDRLRRQARPLRHLLEHRPGALPRPPSAAAAAGRVHQLKFQVIEPLPQVCVPLRRRVGCTWPG